MSEEKKVLIVDDDEPLCYMLSAAIRLRGWIPESVGNFESALVAVRSGPEVVLLDPNLPDSDALETIKGIARLRTAGARRVYVMTGMPVDDTLKGICADFGADGLISKNAVDFRDGLEGILG